MSPPASATTAAGAAGDPRPPADLDQRFYAFCVDRLVAWTVYAVAVALAVRSLFRDGSVGAGVAVIAGTVVLVGLVSALLLGLTGATPGQAMTGVRVVREDSGRPIGVGRALLRTVLLGLAALPTAGLGVAALALNTLRDGSGRRRGWHDRVSQAVVVDARPPRVVEEPVAEKPRQIVNLTALRLVPSEVLPAMPPPPVPPSAMPPPVGPAAVPAPAPAAAGPPPAAPPGLLTGPPPASQPPAATPAATAAVPAAVPAAETPAVPAVVTVRWRVTFDTGQDLLVTGLVLVGRRPEPRPGETGAQLVELASSDMSLSKTHAQLQVVPDGTLVVMDRGSTNGSILVRAGVSRELSAGRAATLRDGDRVRFGDRSMTVVREA